MPLQTFMTKVKGGLRLLPQVDPYTCQSACVAMATMRDDTVTQVRSELKAIGIPGDPYVMGKILNRECPGKYKFEDDACLSEMRQWLKQGEFLIVHTWLSKSGHVIALNGVEVDPSNLSYRLHVLDPYAEFQAKIWNYNSAMGYNGYYSSYLIYATAIAGQSYWDAERVYRQGELDSQRKNAWVHRVLP